MPIHGCTPAALIKLDLAKEFRIKLIYLPVKRFKGFDRGGGGWRTKDKGYGHKLNRSEMM